MADGSGEATFTIPGTGEGGRERYCRGKIVAASAETERVSLATDLDPLKDSQLEIGPFYGGLREAGLEYGATFATVRELWLGKPESGVAIGRVTASQVDDDRRMRPVRERRAARRLPAGVRRRRCSHRTALAFRGAFGPGVDPGDHPAPPAAATGLEPRQRQHEHGRPRRAGNRPGADR